MTESNKGQRYVIRILWSVGVGISHIWGRMTVQYDDKYMCQKKVYEWVEGFKGGSPVLIRVHPRVIPISRSPDE
jgi:hypothetical protein